MPPTRPYSLLLVGDSINGDVYKDLASLLKTRAVGNLRYEGTSLLACDLVLSSALHGIIFADALRVPSVWLHSPHASGGLTSQPPFKYRDYFESVGDGDGRPVRTVEEALTLLDGGDLRPRFTLGRLLHFARRYVEAFPFDAVCDR